MIAVMGATGNTGNVIVRNLLSAGETVRALGRSEDKLEDLRRIGAEVMAGDARDAAYLARAFAGANAAYTLMPYDAAAGDYQVSQSAVGEATVQAIQNAGVRHIVALSSIGADQPSGTGFIVRLHDQEERLKQLKGVNILMLRPGSFFENFFLMLDSIKSYGILGDSVAPDVRLPMIAAADIGDAAACALTARDWSGVVTRELQGPCDLSYAEAAKIIGARIGKPNLPYVQFSYAEMAAALIGVGFPPEMAELHVGLTRGLNEGVIRAREPRTDANTTPTQLEDFAPKLAQAYFAA